MRAQWGAQARAQWGARWAARSKELPKVRGRPSHGGEADIRRPALDSTRILLTGASGGIGTALARRLVGMGATVVLHGRDGDALRVLHSELGSSTSTVEGDLLEGDAPANLAKTASQLMGGLDVVVANAGAGWGGSFADMPHVDIDKTVALNLTAPLHLARACVPEIAGSSRESGPAAIVFVSSIAGHLGVPSEVVYSAAKGGLVAAGEALAEEIRPLGIHVGVVSPGPVDTPFFDRRGRPYTRRWPKPIPCAPVVDAVVAAIVDHRAEAILPRWLRVPTVLRAAAPGLYRRLALLFG
ncbi:MAG: SDR family NAD(P)-dependent oxidoreductase [Actinomycetota bacterium]|nr:SDR family NAD(P)-dependent oxidoreductase [Actinomycetota bacterium]